MKSVICVLAVVACGDPIDAVQEPDGCPVPLGEFGPSDCAIVKGRAIDTDGRALGVVGLRVDSVDSQSYVFSSNATVTASDGTFELTVYRLDPALLVRHVDSATVPIKAYLHDGLPQPRQPADKRAWILMHMAPMGQPVRLTEGTFILVPEVR